MRFESVSGQLRWKNVPLKRVASVSTGTSPSATDDGVVPIIGSNGQIGSTRTANVNDDVLVVGRVGSAGAVTLVRGPAWVSDNALIVRPSTGLSELPYLAYVLPLLSLPLDASQTAQPLITQTQVRERSIPLPSPELQVTIAAFLDSETSRIDALITKKRQMIELLRTRWLTAVRHQMCTLSASHGDIALKRLVTCLDGHRIPLSAEERASRQGEYPYFGASGQIDTVDDYLFDETLVLLGEDGAQLADPDYEISFVVSGRVWVNNHAHVLRPTAADPWFLAAHLSTVDRALAISGATREKITQADMNEIPVPNISLPDQRSIAKVLRDQRARADHCENKLREQLFLLQEHRRTLITAAVTGQLDVPGLVA